MKPVAACLLCGAPSAHARVRQARAADALVECPECGLVYANPQPEPEELDALYARHFGGAENATPERRAAAGESSAGLHRVVLADILRRYPRLASAGRGEARRALDFGCGSGQFLDECRRAGFEVAGIEMTEAAARGARERLGLDVKSDPRKALGELAPGSCHLVTAWQVIEHATQPREILEGLARALAPGGVLGLATPSLNCWRYRLEGARWFNVRNPTHLVFFNRRNLSRCLAELGLGRMVRPVFWGGRPGFGAIANAAQYFVRLAGLGSDLRLYAQRPE